METAQQKIKFSDLSFPIKVAIITGWITAFDYFLYYLAGFFFG